MLPKAYRLPARQRLQWTRFFKTTHFTLRVVQNNLDVSRFGFIVKKTVDKRATVRNRIRRLFRSCIEEMLGSIREGQDMLFSLEKGIIGKSRGEVLQEIKKLLSEKKLLEE